MSDGGGDGRLILERYATPGWTLTVYADHSAAFHLWRNGVLRRDRWWTLRRSDFAWYPQILDGLIELLQRWREELKHGK